jgi:hypothetical protein
MAYEDLTIEEQQALQQSLLAPPPAMFAQAQPFEVDPLTRAQAAAGMLGTQGRFFEQMARQQDEAKLESAAADMARELMSVTPLEMGKKAQELASRNPKAFSTSTVQQALQLGSLARQEQKLAEQEAQQAKGLEMAQNIFDLPRQGFAQALKERAKADPNTFLSPIVQSAITAREGELSTQAARREKKQKAKQDVSTGKVHSWIATSSPEALNDFEDKNPQLVAKFVSKIDARRKELSEMETLKAQLPATLVEKAPARLSELKAAADKWERSLPASLRKIDGFANRQRAVELAEKIQAMKDPSKKPGTIDEDEQALRDELADILFPGKDLVMIPEGTLENLVKSKNSLYGEDAFRPKMKSHTNDLISSKIPQSALGQPEEQP